VEVFHAIGKLAFLRVGELLTHGIDHRLHGEAVRRPTGATILPETSIDLARARQLRADRGNPIPGDGARELRDAQTCTVSSTRPWTAGMAGKSSLPEN